MAPLPLIKPHCGLRLPPDRHCLLSVNYKLRASELQPKKLNKSALDRTAAKNKSIGSTIVKRQNPQASIPKTQTVNIPKPVFKFSANSNGNSKATVPGPPIATPATKAQVQANASQILHDVKMEVEDDFVMGIKRKRDDDEDDFEVVG